MTFKNFFVTIAIAATMIIGAAGVIVTPVLAEANCGPYGICTPDTDIEIGDFVITDEAIAGMALSYIAGIGFIANAQFIKSKLGIVA